MKITYYVISLRECTCVIALLQTPSAFSKSAARENKLASKKLVDSRHSIGAS